MGKADSTYLCCFAGNSFYCPQLPIQSNPRGGDLKAMLGSESCQRGVGLTPLLRVGLNTLSPCSIKGYSFLWGMLSATRSQSCQRRLKKPINRVLVLAWHLTLLELLAPSLSNPNYQTLLVKYLKSLRILITAIGYDHNRPSKMLSTFNITSQ